MTLDNVFENAEQRKRFRDELEIQRIPELLDFCVEAGNIKVDANNLEEQAVELCTKYIDDTSTIFQMNISGNLKNRIQQNIQTLQESEKEAKAEADAAAAAVAREEATAKATGVGAEIDEAAMKARAAAADGEARRRLARRTVAAELCESIEAARDEVFSLMEGTPAWRRFKQNELSGMNKKTKVVKKKTGAVKKGSPWMLQMFKPNRKTKAVKEKKEAERKSHSSHGSNSITVI